MMSLALILLLQDDGLSVLVGVLKQSDDAEVHLSILQGVHDALQGRRRVPMPAGWAEVSAKLRASPKPEVRVLAGELAVTFGDPAAVTALRTMLRDVSADREARRRALESLAGAEVEGLAADLHALLKDAALRGDALRALKGVSDAATPGEILDRYPSFGAPDKVQALSVLASRPAWARALKAAVERKVVARGEFAPNIVRALRELKDPEVGAWVDKTWAQVNETPEEARAEIARLKKVLALGAADTSSGRATFARLCMKCHTLYGAGGKLGPDITGSNRADLDYILQNILDPNALIPEEYVSYLIITKDGGGRTGRLISETATAVTIHDPEDPEPTVIPQAEIEEKRKSALSVMPTGLLAGMKDDQVRDLVAYLGTRGQVPMAATDQTVDFFFNGKDLSLWEGDLKTWSVQNGEIVGRSEGLKDPAVLTGPLMLADFRLTVEVRLTPESGRGAILFRGGARAGLGAGEANVKPGDWNLYEITAVGHRLRTRLNGKPGAELTDEGARRGVVALQLQPGPAVEVRFRNFKLQLEPKPEK